MGNLEKLLAEIRQCRLCEEHLPLGARPVLRARVSARLLIVGQAPGTKVHASGIPWDDPSGDRLRLWLNIDKDTFYDQNKVAIIPMGFCYPGRLPKGGDKPPRPECAPTWHPPLLEHLPNIEMTVLAGAYSQKRFLGSKRARNLTETVRAWRDHAPEFMPLPHPSWRTVGWQKRNPWFDAEVLPALRRRVRELI
ncbi:MAG: uracil-DNA glycosylase family protein [Rhodospirillaceae bacterium]|jgi:uracil-DNA glycosylase|nr:uracil-DNA glycosylase family protein [Rhodospirillaceae bacterium]MBT5896770.1 uracil-DNA glycosylase family protein [Rhodospirillaceae bacterium]MBT6428573.1 uracil-DNA glycosylase family protein [Rhodospirillaceae bacterium]MBT7757669.1 uracil-DNA glycosylase family protein [Rhodospirillaceae bacterium]